MGPGCKYVKNPDIFSGYKRGIDNIEEINDCKSTSYGVVARRMKTARNPDGVGVIGVCLRRVNRELSDRFLSILHPREWLRYW